MDGGTVVMALFDDAVEGADAETLLTTEDTMERSTASESVLLFSPFAHGSRTFFMQSIKPGLYLELVLKTGVV